MSESKSMREQMIDHVREMFRGFPEDIQSAIATGFCLAALEERMRKNKEVNV